MASGSSRRRHRGLALQALVFVLTGLAVVGGIAFLVAFRTALYHRLVSFPREMRAWEALRAQRIEVALDDGYTDYQGVCHSHSEISHDSCVPFDEILRVMKETGRDFILMSDHCVDGKADYSLHWRGVKDGVLFAPGFEMYEGFMPWGLPTDTVLECGEDLDTLAQRIDELGGLLFFAHTEEPRRWDLPQLKGMEIYNLHTDFLDEELPPLIPDLILNLGKYPDLTFRLIFDRQTAILANWDHLNETRRIVGIAANDCHQNNGFIGTYTEQGTVRVRDTSPKTVGEYSLNALTRPLVRLLFGPLEPGRELFHVQLDPYERMTRFVATHILANELHEQAILAALEQGRVYIGFDMIVDSTGFTFLAESGGQRATMGDTLPFADGLILHAASPVPCRFTIKRHGESVHQTEGVDMTWTPVEAGKYRVEAELDICGEWVPWVYTNPIEITAGPMAKS